MEHFAIPMADRETAILPGTEGATSKTFDLQRFGPGNPFGIAPVDDAPGDTSEGETTPETPDTPETTPETTGPASASEGQTPAAAPTQTPAQGHSAAPSTGESPAAQDALAEYRGANGQLDIARLAKDFNYHKGEVGRLRNELGAARTAVAKPAAEQATQTQTQTGETAQAAPDFDWEAADEQFMAEFAKAPARTFLQAVQAVAQEMVKPIQQQISQYQQERGQQQFESYVSRESTTWWDAHKDIPDSVKSEMDAQFDHWAFLLQVPDKKDPSRPAKTPSELLDMLYKLAQGSAAPNAIQQAAEAAASAAVEGQAAKLGAQAGTGATKAPAAPSNQTGLEELAETARSVRGNAFGIMGG